MYSQPRLSQHQKVQWKSALERCWLRQCGLKKCWRRWGWLYYILCWLSSKLFLVYIHHFSPINLLILLDGCISKPKASADLGKEIGLDFTDWTSHDFCDDFSLSSQKSCDVWSKFMWWLERDNNTILCFISIIICIIILKYK